MCTVHSERSMFYKCHIQYYWQYKTVALIEIQVYETIIFHI